MDTYIYSLKTAEYSYIHKYHLAFFILTQSYNIVSISAFHCLISYISHSLPLASQSSEGTAFEAHYLKMLVLEFQRLKDEFWLRLLTSCMILGMLLDLRLSSLTEYDRTLQDYCKNLARK